MTSDEKKRLRRICAELFARIDGIASRRPDIPAFLDQIERQLEILIATQRSRIL